MQVIEKNLREVQEKSARMSDFLRMEYLESVLAKFHDIDIHRYCYLELSKLYETRKMYSDAIKYIFKYQESVITQTEKNNAMMKEIELLMKAGQYERADLLVKKLMEHIKEREKFEVIRRVVELYKQEAFEFERISRFSSVARIYEKLLYYLSDADKNEIKRRLIMVYKKLGKVKESLELEKQLQRGLA
jgi:tetratricopeptide (TPR) repeat protein